MKAVQINRYQGLDFLEMNKNLATPSIKANQVLVEVHAAGLNPIDRKIMDRGLKGIVPLSFPVTLGGDFSGIITEAGADVSGLKKGDAVYGQAIILNGGSGSLAELAASNAQNTALKPKNTNFVEAASLPLAGCSAIQAIEDHIKLDEAGHKILIHGGAGGIGSIAIQLAKALGFYVITTVSEDDENYAVTLGADKTIDYKKQSFEEVVKGIDAVFDTVGGETTNRSLKVLIRGGILVSMAGKPDMELAKRYGVRAMVQSTVTNTHRLNRLTELVEKGKVKVQLDEVFPFEQTQTAFRYLELGPRGKVVVKIRD